MMRRRADTDSSTDVHRGLRRFPKLSRHWAVLPRTASFGADVPRRTLVAVGRKAITAAAGMRLKRRIIRSPVEGLFVSAQLAGDRMRARREPALAKLHREHWAIRQSLALLIGPASNCVDVGGHIGSVLSEMIRLAPHGSHVVVEADPSKANWLSARFPEVEVVSAAVSDSAGMVDFGIDVERPGYSHIMSKGDGAAPQENLEVRRVRCVTLDEELAGRRIDVMKVDVEGAELPCLRGALGILEAQHPRMVFEAAFYPGDLWASPLPDTYRLLVDQLGYLVYLAVDFADGSGPLTIDEFVAAHEFPFQGWNYVAIPADDPLTQR